MGLGGSIICNIEYNPARALGRNLTNKGIFLPVHKKGSQKREDFTYSIVELEIDKQYPDILDYAIFVASKRKEVTTMTPNELDVLLHYHTFIEEHPRLKAPAVQDALKNLIKKELLTVEKGEKKGIYHSTERGKIWLEMILSTPLPIMKWSDPRT